MEVTNFDKLLTVLSIHFYQLDSHYQFLAFYTNIKFNRTVQVLHAVKIIACAKNYHKSSMKPSYVTYVKFQKLPKNFNLFSLNKFMLILTWFG